MNKRTERFWLLFIAIITIYLLSACSSNPTEVVPPIIDSVQPTATDTTLWRKRVVLKCGVCQ